MDYKSKKKERLRRLYEFNSYDSDDKIVDEPLLDDNIKEEIFINNDSIPKTQFKSKLKEKTKKNNIINNNNNKKVLETNTNNNSFNYIVQIDFNKRKYISENSKNRKFLNNIPKNTISTSKYTIYNALPKILLEQFSKIANIYFLIIAFFQCIKEISNSNGKPVILFPLFIVVSVNGLKDFYEDWKRKKSDDQENNKNTLIYSSRKKNFIKKQWKDILLGDIIKVKEDEFFPADCVLLNTSEESNCCYIETKSIDGETNLKFKKSNKTILELTKNNKDKENLINFDKSIIQCQQPNEYIYQFNGKFLSKFNNTNNEIFLDIDNFILRGCSLKQTSYIYAVVVYVGHDTKIMRNSVSAKEKVSKIEHIMNHQIIIVFILQFIIGAVSSLIGNLQLFLNRKKLGYIFPVIQNNDDFYSNNKNFLNSFSTLPDNKEEVDLHISFSNFIITTGTWIILINNIVPISLLMTLEMVKYLQGTFISWDYNMYDLINHQKPKVQTSTLNEELGQVKFIFTDKTGTLTKNYMEYKAMSINGKIYGIKNKHEKNKEEKIKKKKKLKDNFGVITNFNFHCKDFNKDYVNNLNIDDNQYQKIHLFLLCLSLCHSVITDQNALPDISYKSSSPDETAMVNCARNFGIIFEGRDVYDNIFIMEKNKNNDNYEKITYKLLNCLDYSSERKRMAVIVRAPNNKIYLFAKGADSAIGERITQNKELLNVTGEHLIKFAKHGLRTLMIAYRELSEEEYNIFDNAFKFAMNNPENKDKLLKDAYALVEKNYFLLGATAIEDKLQDNISDVLYSFIEAGIKIWVLTGDKMDTAKSIAYSCKLLDHSFIIFQFDSFNIENKEESFMKIRENLKNFFKIYFSENEKEKNNKYGLIVSLNELNIILENEEIENIFYSLAIKCNTVLCCRVSPKQKAQMVNLVKKRQPEVTTLAIGDGANDVNMITTANIGIGIMGVEGLQAARASDYCIGEFQFLKRLLFVHGRESYRKNSFIVCYNFYKNFLFVLPQFWLGFVNYFSGQYIYDPWIYQMFNIIFACFPIVWFGIYDKEVSYDILVSNSRYYTQGIINKLFHNKRFWKWVIYGIIQAFFVYIYSFYTCLSINDGYLHDLGTQGSIAYSGVVLIVNIKILTTTNSHTFISFGLFLFSVLSYYLILGLMSLYYGFYNFSHFKMIFTSCEFYLSTIFLIVLCTILDKGIDKFCRIFGIILDPLEIDVNKFEPKENIKEMSIIRDEIDEEKNKINNIYTGAAFTYSYNNELKAEMDRRRNQMNNI